VKCDRHRFATTHYMPNPKPMTLNQTRRSFVGLSRIRKGSDVMKSYACAQKTHWTHPVCIQL